MRRRKSKEGLRAATRSRSLWPRQRDPLALGAFSAMAKKGKKKSKTRHLSHDERKSIRRLTRFFKIMHRGLDIVKINDDVWKDMEGTLRTLRRLALQQADATLAAVKELEKQTKHGPPMETLSNDTVADKIKLANQLLVQGMHWDKVDSALANATRLASSEDETLRGQWAFTGDELAAPPLPPDEPAH